MGNLVFILVFLSLFSAAAVSISDKSTMDTLFAAVSPTPLGWSSATQYCDWRGVECDEKKRVLSLTLPSQSLSGNLPPSLNTLTHIIDISLQNNQFTGQIPSFANLSRLRKLDLGNNSFTSIHTGAFSSLISLHILCLSNNTNLSPWPFPTDLANSPEMVALHASNANIMGEIPDIFRSFGSLVNLTLSNNNLTGSLPGSFNGSAIQDLKLDNQKLGLTGNIDLLSGMTNLSVVWLNGNTFSGVVPASFVSLPNLVDVRLEKNEFSESNNVGSFNCRRCKVYIRADSVSSTAPANSSSGKKINVGAVVGFSIALVSLILFVIFCLCCCKIKSARAKAREIQLVASRQRNNARQQQRGRDGKKKEEKPGKKDAVVQEERGGDGNEQRRDEDDRVDKAGKRKKEEKDKPQQDGEENRVNKAGKRKKEKKDKPQQDGEEKRGGDGNEQRRDEDDRVDKAGKREKEKKDKPQQDGEENRVDKAGKRRKEKKDKPQQDGEEKRGGDGNEQPRDEDDRVDKAGKREKENQQLVSGDEEEALRRKKGKQLVEDDDIGLRARSDKENQQLVSGDEEEALRRKKGKQLVEDEDIGVRAGSDKGNEEVIRGENSGKDKKLHEQLLDEVVDNQCNKDKEGIMVLDEVVEEQGNSLGLPINKYTHTHLKRMTNNFHQDSKIGGGGFGNVYKGILPDGATMVAVKCLKSEGQIDDFNNEVEALGRADHFNLVKLLGYCDDEKEGKFLVYEFMSNGSLDNWIFHPNSRGTLSWPEKKDIIQGIAQGLAYLHGSYPNKILHRDLKPPNVVLDGNKKAKLCDFGVAKLLDKDKTSTFTQPFGSYWYAAPELYVKEKFNEKIDVYSFGVVVLEILFGERYNKLGTVIAYNCTVQVQPLPDLIARLSSDMRKNRKQIMKIGELAMRCLQNEPKERPSMAEIQDEIQTLYKQSDKPKPKIIRRRTTTS